MMEVGRFFIVALIGLMFDLAISWLLANHLGWPLWLAAASGFVSVAALNYVLHELWTFRNGEQQLSASRALGYSITLLITLAVRVAVVAWLAVSWGSAPSLLVLVMGAFASFVVNFLLSKTLVFRSNHSPDRLAP